MDSLPTEILNLILLCDVQMCRCDKNLILPLRLVCKAFDAALKPYVFKTVQLEFSRFLRHEKRPGLEHLRRVGDKCEAVYLDMMVVRDEEEIARLSNVFQGLIPKVPEMVPLLDSLRRYCMNESTFDETDFREVLENVLTVTPNLRRMKLNLPFQVVGQQARTATLLLATTMAALAKRPEEFKVLDTLVLDHVSDTTLVDICNNPMDLGNAIKSFSGLRHLVLSIKRQDARHTRQTAFAQNLWFLIRKAVNMDSLCLIGWNVKRDITTRIHGGLLNAVSINVWTMRCLPFYQDPSQRLERLRYLELKRVDIEPRSLLELVKEIKGSLKEVYLNEVYMKVNGDEDGPDVSLWIGHTDIPRPENSCWLAEDLRDIHDLRLDILRATGLGYDDFDPPAGMRDTQYDLADPSGRMRSFDQRFVEAVMGASDVEMSDVIPSSSSLPHISSILPEITAPILPANVTSDLHSQRNVIPDLALPPINSAPDSTSIPASELPVLPPLKRFLRKQKEYDAETYQRYHNTTSHFKRCIDGYFFNHNEQALKELQNIITVADRGMTLLSAEIDRARYGGTGGESVPPPRPPPPPTMPLWGGSD